MFTVTRNAHNIFSSLSRLSERASPFYHAGVFSLTASSIA